MKFAIATAVYFCNVASSSTAFVLPSGSSFVAGTRNRITLSSSTTPVVTSRRARNGVTTLSMADRRVVVTGMGITSCLGNTLPDVLESLRGCKSGIKFSEEYNKLGIRSQVCARPDIEEAEFKALIPKASYRFMGTNAKYAYVAMQRAIEDAGFEDSDYTLGFAKTNEDLMNYREAEVKHARLAMLAAAGWPLSEVFDKKIASALGMVPILDSTDRAPSLLNGGLGKISPLYWIGCVGLAAAIDLYGISKARNADSSSGYFPGNLGFDPLGLYPDDAEGQKRMQLAEIKNGRLAMIAVTGFAMQEAVYQLGVVDKTPLFFLPISETLHQYTNAGYIQ